MIIRVFYRFYVNKIESYQAYSERGMQDVFLFHKNACASRQWLFIRDEKFD